MPRRSDLHGGLYPLGSRRGKRNGLIALAVFAPELPNTIELLPGFWGLPFHHLDVLREPRSKRNTKETFLYRNRNRARVDAYGMLV